jgi:uncharacterized membrane protein
MRANVNKLTYRIAVLALLMALIAVFWYGIGTIPLGFIKITISCLPVIIGTIVLGVEDGLILGAFFGFLSFLSGPAGGLTAPIFSAHVLWGVVLCFVPRLLVPLVTHAVYRMTRKFEKKHKWTLSLTGAAGSLTNTVFFLGFILLLYALLGINGDQVAREIDLKNGLEGSRTLMAMIGTTVLVGGIPEAVLAAIATPTVIVALRKAHLTIEK